MKRVSRVTPREVGSSTYGTGMSSSFGITFSFAVESEKSVVCVLLQLISMHHSFAQELTLLMVCLAEVQAIRSSACDSRWEALTMSFTYRSSRDGERTLACTTPHLD